MKVNWNGYRDHVLAVISLYREHNKMRQDLSVDSQKRKLHQEDYSFLYQQINGLRSAIVLLYPNDSLVKELNGFILFASESVNYPDDFIKRIHNVVDDLNKVAE